MVKVQRVRTSGEVRLFKLHHNFMFNGKSGMEEEREPRLLLVGESNCEEICGNGYY